MIADYRIYATIYTVLCVAWIAAFPMIRFRPKMADRYMGIVAGTASIIIALNVIDWLWS